MIGNAILYFLFRDLTAYSFTYAVKFLEFFMPHKFKSRSSHLKSKVGRPKLSSLKADPENWKLFAYMSANFQHILGTFDLEKQYQLFTDYQDFSEHRAQTPVACIETVLKDIPALDQRDPKMWVSFHLGIYQFLPLRLLLRGISVCLIVSKTVLQEYKVFYENLLAKFPISGPLYLQEAEDPSIFFKLKKNLQKGYHIFVFADGAFGSIDDPKSKLQEVDLLQGSIKVRCGFVRIAIIFNLKILKIVDRSIDPSGLEAPSISEITGKKKNHGKDNHQNIIQDIYSSFEEDLLKCPQTWETWRYLHRYYYPSSCLQSWKTDHRILPMKDTNEYLLLDKFTYRWHRIDAKQYKILSSRIF